MSLLQNLAAQIEALDAAKYFSPAGVLTGPAPLSAAMTLCDEGQTRESYDVTGVRTVVWAYKLHICAVLLTQAEHEAAQMQIEALCAQIGAMALPQTQGVAVVQDVHCGGAQTATCDDSGRCTWSLPLWMEMRGV